VLTKSWIALCGLCVASASWAQEAPPPQSPQEVLAGQAPGPTAGRALKRVPVKGEALAPAPEGEQTPPPTPQPAAAPPENERRVLVRPEVKPSPDASSEEAGTRTLTRASATPEGALDPAKVERAVIVSPSPVAGPEPDLSAPFVFAYPVKKPRITSHFGMRKHPKLKKKLMHKGTDFGAPVGVEVLATGPGKVTRAGDCGAASGNCVVLEHPQGWVSHYLHLSEVTVAVGQVVGGGAVIGKVGSTGRSTGPHLHFQVEKGGEAVNAVKLFGVSSDKAQ
jgi:murein DD-endopeptidase MepM/ murein hydrolase activator NlpD